jgi:hypothetical protein
LSRRAELARILHPPETAACYPQSMKMRTRRIALFAALLYAVSANSQTLPDFTGHWRQQSTAGDERRLDIEQNGNTLRVNTTVVNSKGTRRLAVTYQIGGPETVYKGLDGDKFHSRLHWDGSTLVFEIVEHEAGRTIPQTTVWTLSEDGNAIRQTRQGTKSGKDSSVSYIRQR